MTVKRMDLLTEAPGWAVMHPLTKDPVLDVRTVGTDCAWTDLLTVHPDCAGMDLVHTKTLNVIIMFKNCCDYVIKNIFGTFIKKIDFKLLVCNTQIINKLLYRNCNTINNHHMPLLHLPLCLIKTGWAEQLISDFVVGFLYLVWSHLVKNAHCTASFSWRIEKEKSTSCWTANSHSFSRSGSFTGKLWKLILSCLCIGNADLRTLFGFCRFWHPGNAHFNTIFQH